MRILFYIILLGLATATTAAEVRGIARVIDGDTIEVQSTVIRLYGIDAAEDGQSCTDSAGKTYSCGKHAEKILSALLQQPVICVGKNYDQYNRLIGVCQSNNIEINSQMVYMGWALAYRKYSLDYIQEEKKAKDEHRGMWAGHFDTPSDYRASKWKAAVTQSDRPGCPIKGNINRKGQHIYHAPWSRSYSRTNINTKKGERWFCTEAEALQAGWRAPYR